MTKYQGLKRETIVALKALADGNRLRILYALREGELCVCQLIALLGLAPSTVSKHLTVLRSTQWVESRKDGRWMHYRLTDRFRCRGFSKILHVIFAELEKDQGIRMDRQRLKTICEEDRMCLCKRLFGKAQQ